MESMSKELKFKEIEFNLTNYETFVKEPLENKERLKGAEVILASEECSVIIKQEKTELSKKIKDPRSYTFPCNVGN